MDRIVSEYEYKLLKILSESKEGLTEKEIKDTAITDNGEGIERKMIDDPAPEDIIDWTNAEGGHGNYYNQFEKL